jgi:hypothetical protein
MLIGRAYRPIIIKMRSLQARSIVHLLLIFVLKIIGFKSPESGCESATFLRMPTPRRPYHARFPSGGASIMCHQPCVPPRYLCNLTFHLVVPAENPVGFLARYQFTFHFSNTTFQIMRVFLEEVG